MKIVPMGLKAANEDTISPSEAANSAYRSRTTAASAAAQPSAADR